VRAHNWQEKGNEVLNDRHEHAYRGGKRMDSIDLGRAVKAPFNDKQWGTKTLLGFLWLILVVTSPAVFGAQIEYIKDVAEGREELPTWDDFGGKWVKGFLVMVAYFIYLLPIWVLALIMVVPGIIAGVASNGDAGAGLLSGGVCLFIPIAFVYSVGIAVLMYGATVNYAMRGGFGSLFAISEILDHVRDGSGYFAAWLWAIVISIGASVITSVLGATAIGSILTPAVIYLELMMMSHVFGQWAARSYGSGMMAAAAAPGGYPPPPPAYTPPMPPAAPDAFAPAQPAGQFETPAPADVPQVEPPVPPMVEPPVAPPVAPPAEPPAAPATPVQETAPPMPPAAPAAPDEPPFRPEQPAQGDDETP